MLLSVSPNDQLFAISFYVIFIQQLLYTLGYQIYEGLAHLIYFGGRKNFFVLRMYGEERGLGDKGYGHHAKWNYTNTYVLVFVFGNQLYFGTIQNPREVTWRKIMTFYVIFTVWSPSYYDIRTSRIIFDNFSGNF